MVKNTLETEDVQYGYFVQFCFISIERAVQSKFVSFSKNINRVRKLFSNNCHCKKKFPLLFRPSKKNLYWPGVNIKVSWWIIRIHGKTRLEDDNLEYWVYAVVIILKRTQLMHILNEKDFAVSTKAHGRTISIGEQSKFQQSAVINRTQKVLWKLGQQNTFEL